MTKASAGASARAAGNLVVGAGKAAYEIPAVIVDAAGYSIDTAVERTTGRNLDYRPFSRTAAAYDPCSGDPWYRETAARTGRMGVTVLTLGTSEIYVGVRDFAETADADALSERMGPFLFVAVPAGRNSLRGSNARLAPIANSRLVIDRYGTLKGSPLSGQAHHLNQDAAFRSVIPTKEGVSIKLQGNAFTEVGSPHYNAHATMEAFWAQFRRGGARAFETPTNLGYSRALLDSLQRAGLSRAEAMEAVRASIRQRIQCGQLGGLEVPRVPGPVN